MDESLSCLIYSRLFTHRVVTSPATGLTQVRESSPVKDRRA